MPRDIIAAVYSDSGVGFRTTNFEQSLYNCAPILLDNGEIGAYPRDEATKDSFFTANNTADRGRGVIKYGGEFRLYLDQDTYYYAAGGEQDLNATTSPGYAGNTGFNEEYTASFVRHLVSGVENLVIVNAGHTSTNASAKHGNIWYTPDGSTVPSSISDADLPCNNGVSITRGGASLDGYFFVCDITGKIYNSDLNDITSWTATNFLTAEREPDIGVYLGKHHDTIVYIGTRSIEFFYNAGNTSGSPLARRQDVAYRVGCYFPNSIVETGDVITFAGTDSSGAHKIYRLENFQLVPISDAKVEEEMRSLGMGSGTFPDITDLDALQHYCWGADISWGLSSGYIFTYDLYFTFFWDDRSGIWSKWSWNDSVTYPGGISTGTSWGGIYPIMSFNGNRGDGTVALHQFINGNMGRRSALDNDAISDMASANGADAFILFPIWDAKTDKKKRINWIRVITENWAGTSGTVSPCNVDFRFAKLDRAKVTTIGPTETGYTTGRTIDINLTDAKLGRIGTGRKWQFMIHWITGHGPVSVVKGLEIDYDVVGE